MKPQSLFLDNRALCGHWLKMVVCSLLLLGSQACKRDDPDPSTADQSETVVRRYIKAIEDKQSGVLDEVFDATVTYSLQFPVQPNDSTTPVNYVGKPIVLQYFANGFSAFGQIQNLDLQLDRTQDPNVIWIRYRQTAEVPARPGRPAALYTNIVVERISLASGRITEIILYENPDSIRLIL